MKQTLSFTFNVLASSCRRCFDGVLSNIKDMPQLKETVPSVYEKFNKGYFVAQKSTHVFSTMAMDQAYEQMNDLLKGDGVVIGITDNPSTLIK